MPPPAHALILAAGLGTRLRPLSLVRAKAAVPVAGEPLVRRIVRSLACQGVRKLVVNLHHLPATITATLGDGSDLDVEVRYSWEQPALLGSAGGPRQALDIIGAETFLVVNGDTLTDVDLSALADHHRAAGAAVTLALTPNREPDRYNGVALDDAGRVVGFVPRGSRAIGSFHLIGIQVAQAAAFRTLPIGQPAESVRGLYDELIASRPGAVCGFVCDAPFWDIGTVADYWRTSLAFLDRERSSSNPSPQQANDVVVAASARVAHSILWSGVRVDSGAVLDDCIVTDGVRVPANASYRRACLVMVDGALTATTWDDVETAR
jgi:NDP-sugar pyrophosphorylase family protein